MGAKWTHAVGSVEANTAYPVMHPSTGTGASHAMVIWVPDLVTSRVFATAVVGALSRDGRWLLFGTFFSVDEDPRRERMLRLGLDQLPSLGPRGASVTSVELSDYQCPNCAELEPILGAAMTKFEGRVRLVHVDLPQWQAHDWSFMAAEWGRCVARISQKSYWDCRRSVFYRQRDITRNNFADLMRPDVEALGITKKQLANCLEDGTEKQALLQTMSRVSSASVSATPTILVNGTLLDMGIESLLQPVVEEALSRK